MNRVLLQAGIAGAALLLPALALPAQHYPAKPIRIVVAFAAGGGDDFTARLVAPRLGEVLGQQVIVENRPGAGGLIGWEYVAKSVAPDGYTLTLGGASMTTAPSLHSKVAFDLLRDFVPISLISTVSFALVIHPSVPARTVKELIVLARGRPGALNYASSGSGAMPHLSAELFKSMAGLHIVHVPYKGAPPAYVDLMSGQVDMYFGTITSALPHVQGGKVRALAVTGARRARVMPDVPTMAEAALPGYEISGWTAIHGPARMPGEAVGSLNAALHKVVAMPDVRERLMKAGSEPQTNTPEQMAEMVKGGVERFGRLIRAAGIKAD